MVLQIFQYKKELKKFDIRVLFIFYNFLVILSYNKDIIYYINKEKVGIIYLLKVKWSEEI